MDELGGQELVEASRRLAVEKHRGQDDKAMPPQPYISHPARVAARVALSYPAAHQAVAWLHDVIEDCGVTQEQLISAGFPAKVVAGVVAMSKTAEDSPDDAIERACSDPIALVVKAADVADNTNPTRLAQVPQPKRDQLRTKYMRYRQVLDDHGGPTMPESIVLDDATLMAIGLGHTA